MTTITEAAPEAKVVAGSDGLLLEIDGQIVPNYDATFTLFEEGEVVTGIVVRIDNDEVLVDIGYKSEGVIPSNELSIRKAVDPHDEVEMGEEVDALVLTKEDQDGRLIMSKKRARFEKAWRRIEAAAESGEPVEGTVIEVVKGGLIIDLGVRGFLPASLVDIRRVPNLDEYLHTKIECKVIELNRSRNNVVLSRRAVLEEERKEQRQEILDRLQPGLIVEGQISNIVDFGAFVDLNGIDGLIHISELSWSHVNHPSEILSIGDTVAVKVLDIDRERQRISLGLKQTQEDPWQRVVDTYNVGDELEGTVTKVVTFGAFVEILDGVEGLVHISELAPHHVENPREIVAPGDEVKVKILEIDSERRRLSLSVKRVEGQVLEPKILPPEELEAGLDDAGEESDHGAGDLDDVPRARAERRGLRRRRAGARDRGPGGCGGCRAGCGHRRRGRGRRGCRRRPTEAAADADADADAGPRRPSPRRTSQPQAKARGVRAGPLRRPDGGPGSWQVDRTRGARATRRRDAVDRRRRARAVRDARAARRGRRALGRRRSRPGAWSTARRSPSTRSRPLRIGDGWRVRSGPVSLRGSRPGARRSPPASLPRPPRSSRRRCCSRPAWTASTTPRSPSSPTSRCAPQRAAARGHVGVDERAARQLPQEEKARRATYTVCNSGSIEQLESELSELLASLRAR